MRTLIPKADDIQQKWYVVDATDVTLGRLSTKVATILRGKNKPYFTPHMDTGDYVVVINAEKVKLTGNKELQKTYQSYSGYPGGLKETSFANMLATKPEEIIKHAIKGMLPKNILGRRIFKNKLRVYSGNEHPHVAQIPETITI